MRSRLLLGIVGLLLVAASMSVFTVDQTETAIVLRLGEPVAGPLPPGLHFKLPFVENAVHFDARILEYETKPAEVLTKDKKTMVVDNYAKWRITGPLKFYTTVGNLARAQARLDDIIYAELRVALGQYSLIEVVSAKRDEIMSQVTEKANEIVDEFGVRIVDVRIKRTDLPPENERAIFGRMRAERERQAKQYRSEGQEESDKIKSAADKERTLILAEIEREASILRGEGEAEEARIYAEAIGQSPEFYSFRRSLEAYRKGMQGNTSLVLTPSSRFLRFLK